MIMMTVKKCSNHWHLFCIFACLLFAQTALAEKTIRELAFTDTRLIDVIRTLSELSDSNIIATPKATQKTITIHLKKVSVLNAIKSICRISELWYRYDADTNTYRIMTREEYGKDLIIRESEHIEVFNVRNANVRIIAQAIQDLFGQRVQLSLGVPAGSSGNTAGSGGGVRNTRTLSRATIRRAAGRTAFGGISGSGRTLTTTGSQIDTKNLSVDQLEKLTQQAQGQSVIDPNLLQQISTQAQAIYITVNNEHNLIIVRSDDRKAVAAIGKLIKEMDIAVPQVMLEMKILNITLGDDINSIFNFELQPRGNNQSLQPIKIGNNALLNSGSLIYEFLNNRLRANIEFLEQNKRVKVLSNPMVLASNHRQAELFIGEESVLTRGFTYNPAVITNGVVASPAYIETQTELQEIGITLRITPRINADNSVLLELEQESSTINPGGGTIPISDGNGNVVNLPIDTVNTARLTGTVLAKDGLTVAVGGLIRSNKKTQEKKVPLLGEIPVIGRVFRSTTETEQDTETVLLITPHILTRPEDSEQIRKQDNRFYQDLNRGFPDLNPPPNRFIRRDDKTTSKTTSASSKDKRKALYMAMSQYAAQTIRIPEIERVKHTLYHPVKIAHKTVSLLPNPALNMQVQASWQRGGLYVTVVEVSNQSSQTQSLDLSQLRGKWLAASSEKMALPPKEKTYLYLISALSFDETR